MEEGLKKVRTPEAGQCKLDSAGSKRRLMSNKSVRRLEVMMSPGGADHSADQDAQGQATDRVDGRGPLLMQNVYE